MNIADRLDSVWPADAEFRYGEPVEKFTGEARWEGVVVSAYLTTAGKLRYVVEVKPQGFQMIAVPSQLRAPPPPDMIAVEVIGQEEPDWIASAPERG